MKNLEAKDRKKQFKYIARRFVPPIVIDAGRWLRSKTLKPEVPEWEYIPEGWVYTRTHSEVKGWNVPDVLETYKRKWPKYVAMVQGTGTLGVSHESALTSSADINSHNTIMAFAYAITLAAHRLESLAILDWGGGIGHYYLLAKSLMPQVKIDYHCKDVPVLAEYGAQLFPEQQFCTDESCLERTYDFVMASTSLHYTEDWRGLLAGLARATQGYLYITRLPTVRHAKSFVFVQRPYAYGYNTEYLGWCLNRTSFLSEAEKVGLTKVREFVIAEQPSITNAPEQCQYGGYLFRSSPVE